MVTKGGKHRSLRKLWAGGAVGLGLAGVAAGVVLIIKDGSGTCSIWLLQSGITHPR